MNPSSQQIEKAARHSAIEKNQSATGEPQGHPVDQLKQCGHIKGLMGGIGF
jgi:hypothetical protein